MSELWNEVYRYGSAGLTEDVVDELLEIIEERDTRTAAPRFTAEESEAMEVASACMECKIDKSPNGCTCMMCHVSDYDGDGNPECSDKVVKNAIATIRAMLTESDKGKG